MRTVAYQCPCCGAPLAYGAQSRKLECAACGNQYELDALEAMNDVVKDFFELYTRHDQYLYTTQTRRLQASSVRNAARRNRKLTAGPVPAAR